MIALFAMFHGIHEWSEMILLLHGEAFAPIEVIKLATLPLSFLFLLSFGLTSVKAGSLVRRAVPLALSAAWIALTFTSSRPLLAGDVFARYLLGAPGIFLTSYALAAGTVEFAPLRQPGLVGYLKTCSAAFLIYGVTSGMVVPAADFFPASVLNYDAFENAAGFPIQLVRAGCVFVFSFGLIKILSIFELQAIDALQKAQAIKVAQLAAIVESSEDAIIGKTADGIVTSWNKGAEMTYGYTAGEMIGRSLRVLIPPELQDELQVILEKAGRGEGIHFYETARVRKDGKRIAVSLSVSPIRDTEGTIVGASTIARDITAKKELEERIEFQASHDALTLLPTRTFFTEIFRIEMLQAARNRRKIAVLFLDLDRFKEINDTLGHVFGDELLKKVAEKLKSVLRKSDSIARIGGDEFNILLTDLGQSEDALVIVKKIISGFQGPCIVRGRELRVTASIGISIFPDDSAELETLLRYADIALYHAKERGRNNFQFYNDEINITSIERIKLENDLRRAVNDGEFRLYFQPQIDIGSRTVTCAEVLLRWQHPELGLLEPDQFIPLAEETGLIVPIGEWVLRTACEQNRLWQERGFRRIGVSVNISDRQFRRVDLLTLTEQILQKTRLDPKWLELEITENTVMRDAEFTIEKLNRLAERGIALSLDDFGTGYSSLSYLKRLPVRKIKIDKSFIRDVMTNASDRAIVYAVIGLTHNLNMQVIAEGVETEEQLALLRDIACDGIQGFLFSRPLPVQEFEKLLA
jgi:diguanylate cyclase (GGDEF)-like protein/PAS domain S-box-containing protein